MNKLSKRISHLATSDNYKHKALNKHDDTDYHKNDVQRDHRSIVTTATVWAIVINIKTNSVYYKHSKQIDKREDGVEYAWDAIKKVLSRLNFN